MRKCGALQQDVDGNLPLEAGVQQIPEDVDRRLRVHGGARHPAVGDVLRPAQVHLRHGGVGHLGPVVQRQRQLGGLVLRALREEELRARVVGHHHLGERLQLRVREEAAQAVRAQVLPERLAPVQQERLQREPLVLAVQEVRFGLVRPRVHVVVVQTLDLGQSHGSPWLPPASTAITDAPKLNY
ncbi:hypothetical protein EYF80_053198 [Liparis tanakae]|uniref:Uncharacterized protein n=1 Tax=Liparis tanakae TaxID=230148 RepID=A0A4Z2F658_9TELE|nr:hypothetical protein EYF80_053198 [Liparis tanakae]